MSDEKSFTGFKPYERTIVCLFYENGHWGELQTMDYEEFPSNPHQHHWHYGLSGFEGMKVFRDENGNIHIFMLNSHRGRFKKTQTRLGIPLIPKEFFEEAVVRAVRANEKCIPFERNGALYIRPNVFSCSDTTPGVFGNSKFALVVSVAPLFTNCNNLSRAIVELHDVRSAPGGLGAVKAGANYAYGLRADELARTKGYQHVLWTHPVTQTLQEFSTQTIFIVVDGVLYTPTLDGTILDGITRKAIINLGFCNGMPVTNRPIKLQWFIDALKNNAVSEVFGAGSAVAICPFGDITYGDTCFELPKIDSNTSVAHKMYNLLTQAYRGELEGEWTFKLLKGEHVL